MTDTPLAAVTDVADGGGPAHISADSIAEMQRDLDQSIEGIRQIIANSTGLPAGLAIALDPPEVAARMLADGSLDASNEFVLSLAGAEARFSIGDVVEHGGDINAVITAKLVELGAMLPLTDRQLINALLARIGGAVELTLEEVAAAQRPSTLQFDGLKISLLVN